MLHLVGSNNDLKPWTGIGLTAPTPAQVAEERARMANPIKVVRDSFATARKRQDRAVVLMLQAVRGSADDLRRITIDGSSNNNDWLKVTVNHPGSADVLSWTQVPYTS